MTVAAWLDGRASATVRSEIESHLDSCTSCRELCADVVRAARPAPRTLGRFELGKCLGRGAMGEVYAAFDPQLGRRVALKLPRAESGDVQRLLREARMMAQVAHPNVLAVHEVGELDGVPYVVMEHVEGMDLAARAAQAELTTREIVAIVASVARGLAAVHRVGLVHRDVKPANILIDQDDRARLGDFGLAGVEPVHAVAAGNAGLHVSQTNDVVGTPAYMAPELLRGERATPASDQFALCVVLFELIHGERPFAGANLGELSRNVLAGAVRDVKSTRHVPAHITRVVRRGLASDADARFPSVAALADALERRPRTRAIAIGVGGALLVAGAATAFALGTARHDEPCSGAAAELAGTWGPPQRAAITRAFAASKLPFASASATRVIDTFDRYATNWIGAQRAACVANRVRHVDSDAQFDRRTSCLADGRRQLAVLVGALAQASDEQIEKASTAARALPEPADCENPRGFAVPADPARRVQLAMLEQRYAAGKAQHDLGDYKGALATGTALVRDVAVLDAPRIATEAWSLVALAKQRTGDAAGSEAAFRAALEQAARAGSDARIVELWGALIYMIGSRPGRSADAVALVDSARLALVRAGNLPALELSLESNIGTVKRRSGDIAGARVSLERALALSEQLHGKDAPEATTTLTNYASVLFEQGEWREGLAIYTRVLALEERVHGPAHPIVAQARANLAALLVRNGDPARAAAETRKALAILEPAWGADNRRVLLLWNNLGVALSNSGSPDEARRAYEHVLAQETRAPLEALDALNGLAKLEQQAKQLAKAIELHERAFALRVKLQGDNHPDVGITLFNLGNALRDAKRCKDALPHFERAEQLLSALAPDHNYVGYAQSARAMCLIDLGRGSEARPLLASVHQIAKQRGDRELLAEVERGLHATDRHHRN